MVGVIAAVVARRVDHGLSGWDEFGIVVAGSLVTALVLWVVQSMWRRVRAPRLVLACGNEGAFRTQMTPEARHHPPESHFLPADLVYVTRLSVRETRNRAGPRRVHVRVTDADPPQPQPLFPKGLQWVNGEDYYDIPPGGRGWIRLCEDVRTGNNRRVNWFSSVPGLEPGACIRFTVEVLENDKANGSPKTFTADWTRGGGGLPYPDVSEA